MNTAHPENARIPASKDLTDFIINDYLKPYFQSDNFFSQETAGRLKRTIPLVLNNLFTAVFNIQHSPVKPSLEIGGSSMEVYTGRMTADEYFSAKLHIKQAFSGKIPPPDNETKIIYDAIKTLALGDPDIDLYLDGIELKALYESLQQSPQPVEEGIGIELYYGAAYPGALVKRLYLQLYDAKNKQKLFHIDITNKPKSGDEAGVNRRQHLGTIHDQCRGKLELHKKIGGSVAAEVNVDENNIAPVKTASHVYLQDKDPLTWFEVSLREARKNLTHWPDISFSQMFPPLNSNDLFQLYEVASDPKKITEIMAKQSDYQKQIIYQEIFLMAQYDPYLTIVFLQDSGLDAVFFGRHLTRRETIKLLTSRWLYFFEGEMRQQRGITDMEKSRLAYLDKPPEEHNGFERFICAIGETLGPRNSSQYKHFEVGWNIVQNKLPKIIYPDEVVKKTEDDDRLNQMFSALINWSGGFTEKRLHLLMQEQYPGRFDDEEEFRKTFWQLKKSGLLEVANRKVLIDDKWRSVRFYYPCVKPQELKELSSIYAKNNLKRRNPNFDLFVIKKIGVETLEALMSLSEKDWELIQDDAEWIIQQVTFSSIQTLLKLFLESYKHFEETQPLRRWVDDV